MILTTITVYDVFTLVYSWGALCFCDPNYSWDVPTIVGTIVKLGRDGGLQWTMYIMGWFMPMDECCKMLG